ncbi:hypothetical protein BDW71DRAFT_217925 [Aspergillus fruticulosus]
MPWPGKSTRNKTKAEKEHSKQVAVFVAEKAPDYHEYFGMAPVDYNAESDKLEPLPADKDLKETLLAYNESVEPQLRIELTTCSFDDVLRELDRAQKAYDQKAQGIRGFMRKTVRSMGDNADALSLWLDIVPPDHGLSLLAAGLTIIFWNADNREKILGALEDIPDLMLRVKEHQNQWRTVKGLQASAKELYGTLTWALARLIVLLNGSMRSKEKWTERACRLFGKVLGPTDAGRKIDGILEYVKKKAKKFDDCLQLVRDQRAIDTGVDVFLAREAILRVESQLKGMKEESNEGYATLLRTVEERPTVVYICNVMQQTIGNVPPQEGHYERASPPPRPSEPEPFLDEVELHDSLGVSHQRVLTEMELVLKELPQFETSAQAQAQQLFSSRAFSDWMASSWPATLLVHDKFDAPGSGRITALSVLCAMFALQLRNSHRQDQTIVLHHFCGLHRSSHDPTDPIAGPNGLMRSLVAQILRTGRRFNLGFINTRSFAHDICMHSLQMLCHTFSLLVEDLPRSTTVICILDGVSEFTSQQWREEMTDVLLILERLVTNSALRANFKLLCTTLFVRGGLVDQLTVHFPLELHPWAYADDGYGLSERSLARAIDQGDRLDYFRQRMRMNQAMEKEYSSDDEDSEESDDETDQVAGHWL